MILIELDPGLQIEEHLAGDEGARVLGRHLGGSRADPTHRLLQGHEEVVELLPRRWRLGIGFPRHLPVSRNLIALSSVAGSVTFTWWSPRYSTRLRLALLRTTDVLACSVLSAEDRFRKPKDPLA